MHMESLLAAILLAAAPATPAQPPPPAPASPAAIAAAEPQVNLMIHQLAICVEIRRRLETRAMPLRKAINNSRLHFAESPAVRAYEAELLRFYNRLSARHHDVGNVTVSLICDLQKLPMKDEVAKAVNDQLAEVLASVLEDMPAGAFAGQASQAVMPMGDILAEAAEDALMAQNSMGTLSSSNRPEINELLKRNMVAATQSTSDAMKISAQRMPPSSSDLGQVQFNFLSAQLKFMQTRLAFVQQAYPPK